MPGVLSRFLDKYKSDPKWQQAQKDKEKAEDDARKAKEKRQADAKARATQHAADVAVAIARLAAAVPPSPPPPQPPPPNSTTTTPGQARGGERKRGPPVRFRYRSACGRYYFSCKEHYDKYHSASSNLLPGDEENNNPRKRMRYGNENDKTPRGGKRYGEDEDENNDEPSLITFHVVERWEKRGQDPSRVLRAARHGVMVEGSRRASEKHPGRWSIKKRLVEDGERPLEVYVDEQSGAIISVVELSPSPERARVMRNGSRQMFTKLKDVVGDDSRNTVDLHRATWQHSRNTAGIP
jgi:hypothetical protein